MKTLANGPVGPFWLQDLLNGALQNVRCYGLSGTRLTVGRTYPYYTELFTPKQQLGDVLTAHWHSRHVFSVQCQETRKPPTSQAFQCQQCAAVRSLLQYHNCGGKKAHTYVYLFLISTPFTVCTRTYLCSSDRKVRHSILCTRT